MMPFAIAVNSTPIVALAPIMNQWFGITSPLSKMSIVGVIVFFPVMINVVRGLTQVEAGALELMRSYAASEFAVLFKVRIPNALPYLFSALKVASTLSVIGAVVSEYFGGSREALGVFISQQAALFHFAEAWAAIIVACAMGIAFYLVLLVAERWLMPWHVSLRHAEE
jgi:NitT/TauT family transport system permease protein